MMASIPEGGPNNIYGNPMMQGYSVQAPMMETVNEQSNQQYFENDDDEEQIYNGE